MQKQSHRKPTGSLPLVLFLWAGFKRDLLGFFFIAATQSQSMLHWFHIKRPAQIDNIYDKVLEKLRWTKRIVENKTFVSVHIGWKPDVQQTVRRNQVMDLSHPCCTSKCSQEFSSSMEVCWINRRNKTFYLKKHLVTMGSYMNHPMLVQQAESSIRHVGLSAAISPVNLWPWCCSN